MTRILGLALVALLAGCGDSRPNLLLVTIDTLRADHLQCYGGPPGVGTQLCRLADAGTRFEWALSTAPSTSPSVASLLTSLHVPQHRVTQNIETVLADEALTVAEALRDSGYATAAFVSNPMLHRVRGMHQGFDVYDHRMQRRELNRPGYAERNAQETTDAALAWAGGHPPEPWFLWVHYQDPHGPYLPPGIRAMRDPAGSGRLPVLDDESGRGGIPRYQALPGLYSPEAYTQLYHVEIAQLDLQLRRLVEGLDALGTPPAILVTADHGEAFGEDGYWFAHGHSAGLDQVRVPLLYRPAPGSRGRGAVTDPVSLVDVAPTLLGLAETEVPESFVGRALPLHAGDTGDTGRPLYVEASRQAAVVVGRNYYARDRDPGAAGAPGGRAWGRDNPALPPRTATLAPGGASAGYAAVDAPPAPLEDALAAYLEAHPVRGPAAQAEVPGELREQLRALGYDAGD
ncbi:MAG: sulfatase [Myxococcota bacterium]|nr:sulfatase [Myxococcota bacterium]